MKKNLLFSIMLLTTCITLAQTDYRSLLVRDQWTYWATTKSLCEPSWNLLQTGMRLSWNGIYDWYEIPEVNDTVSLYDLFDTEILISHRTYELSNDTLYIGRWPINSIENKPVPDAAYKILYITEQRMVLLELTRNAEGKWVESFLPDNCEYLRTIEFKYMPPQDNTTK